MASAKSYKPMFLIEGEWGQNAVRFATRKEAEDNARAKFNAWLLAEGYRVDESDDEPNYSYADGRLVAIDA